MRTTKISKETFYDFLIKFVDTPGLWFAYLFVALGLVYASCIMKPKTDYPIQNEDEIAYWNEERDIVFKINSVKELNDGKFLFCMTQVKGDSFFDGCEMKAKYKYYKAKTMKVGDYVQLHTSYNTLYHTDDFYGEYRERMNKINPGKPHHTRPVIDFVILILYVVVTFFMFVSCFGDDMYDEHMYSAIFVLMLFYLVTFLLCYKI